MIFSPCGDASTPKHLGVIGIHTKHFFSTMSNIRSIFGKCQQFVHYNRGLLTSSWARRLMASATREAFQYTVHLLPFVFLQKARRVLVRPFL